MGRSRIRGNVARMLASIALGGIAGIGLVSGGLFQTADDSAWTMRTYSHQVVQQPSGTAITAFDSAWT